MTTRTYRSLSSVWRLTWRGDAVYTRVQAASSAGALSAGRALLRRARPHVPVDTGAMRDSGKETLTGPGRVAVGYLRPGPNGDVITYRQHEDLTLNHPNGGQARWLARAVEEYSGRALTDMATPVRHVLERDLL